MLVNTKRHPCLLHLLGNIVHICIFIHNSLGSASAAFIMEELAAYDAKVVVRLGTNDYNTTEADINKVYVVQECHGLYGLFRDYGFPAREWGRGIPR